ncbi:MAG: response regulator [Candidatus Eisenbacteria bacterium]|nr:response regulator [Candidatus Eisenbacteria bacterium]
MQAPGILKRKWTVRYAAMGVLIGLLIPFVTTSLTLALSGTPFAFGSFVRAQLRDPLLILLNITPVLLGLLAYTLGRRQDNSEQHWRDLEKRLRQVQEANKALASRMGERSELEEQLRHSQKLEAVGRLAGGVAHDFNNLLTAIIGYADLLLAELKPQDQKREYVEEIRRAGERAAALVQQLLGFSRKQMIAPRALDLNAALNDSQKLLRRVIGEDIRLDVIEFDLPVNVLIDPVQVDQILVNLVVNARDAMPEGGTITLRTSRLTLDEDDCRLNADAKPGDYSMLEISDTGTGMSEVTLEKIFEPFFTTKDKSKGTGLGLATTYGIVKQNGGFIDVLSHLGTGTTFRIYLPPHEASGCPSRPGAAAAHVGGGSECILLVEDEDVVRTLAAKTLTDRGYEVLVAEHADAAHEIWNRRKRDVDLLVTDIIMPGQDGKRLSQILTSEKPDMRVLFMSGYDDQLLSEHDVFEDRPDFIPKPFAVEAFACKVREVLDSRQGGSL